MTVLGEKIEVLKSQAAACRRAAASGNRASPYLIEMAARYEREAADLELAYAGAKPALQPGSNNTAG
jgi:hypothetical protein